MKTNKSYSKRLRVTRKGKIVARHSGQDHFNARRSGRQRLNHRRATSVHVTKQDQSRFLSA